jgi:putative ubiquitin-RnfH superfamily antitoxin RatB of RatAB toxin-antitoxin module
MVAIKVRVCWWCGPVFNYKDCFLKSGVTVAKLCDKINLNAEGAVVTCYGKVINEDYVVVDGDRVEVHSLVLIDVKEARRWRFKKKRGVV